MREQFIETNFRASSITTIAQANEIITEYQGRGFVLTLRQLYYQFVSRDLLKNSQSEYKRLGKILNDARLAGLVDWAAIEDRTRNVKKPSVWTSPQSILDAVADQYQEDPWLTQPTYVEVWIEKDALVGVIEGVCEEFRVPHFACRGYASQSELYDAGKRFARKMRGSHDSKRGLILHLGDHDPSGLDMTRDLQNRITMFAQRNVEVRRLALNMDQIEQYDPPPNPAKDTDARFEGYREEFGDSSWELDALDPDVISDLIREQIEGVIRDGAWARAIMDEKKNKEGLRLASLHWPEANDYLTREFGNDEEPI